MPHVTEVTVRYAETDCMGVVHEYVYIVLLNAAVKLHALLSVSKVGCNVHNLYAVFFGKLRLKLAQPVHAPCGKYHVYPVLCERARHIAPQTGACACY